MEKTLINRHSRWIKHWLNQIMNPAWFVRGMTGYLRYFADWWRYTRLPASESIRLFDTYPQLHDRTGVTPIDAHYFYVNGWAMRRIVARQPSSHVDIGSKVVFANLLGAVIPVTFVDYRPLQVELTGLESLGADILKLPFAAKSIESLSCLHVAEHIGLGRYGDPLDPQGTLKAAHELTRVLAEGGNLYFALPVGKPCLCFNAHRIHQASTICNYFSNLELVEFSGVHDDGRYVERVGISEFDDSDYACGFFWFRRKHQ